MKLGDIMQARECGAIQVLSTMPLSDGQKRYKLRKAIEALEAELKTCDDERNRLITAVAPDGVVKGSKEQPEVAKLIQDLDSFYSAESDVQLECLLQTQDLDGIKLSVVQEKALLLLGLAKEME